MLRLTPESLFAHYERTLPESTPRIQRVEMRKAFYAGLAGAIEALVEGVGDSDVSMEEGLDQLMDFSAEIARTLLTMGPATAHDSAAPSHPYSESAKTLRSIAESVRAACVQLVDDFDGRSDEVPEKTTLHLHVPTAALPQLVIAFDRAEAALSSYPE